MKLFCTIAAFLAASATSGQLAISNPFHVAAHLTAPAAGGACTTARDTVNGATTAQTSTGSFKWIAQKFTAGANATICSIVLRLHEEGTATGNLTCGIYTHNAGTDFPNTAVDMSDAVSATLLAASEADFPFSSGLSAAITSGTIYWVVITDSAGGGFSGNGAFWNNQSGGARSAVSSDGTSWSEASPSDAYKFALFSN